MTDARDDDTALDDLDTGIDVATAAENAVDADDPAMKQDPTEAQVRGTQG